MRELLTKINNKLDQWFTIRIQNIPVNFKIAFFVSLTISIISAVAMHNFLFIFIVMFIFLILYKNILIHEFGHILCAKKYGYQTSKVTLHLFGGTAYMNLYQIPPRQHLLIALAGPATNLLQISIQAPLLLYFGLPSGSMPLYMKLPLLILAIDIFHNIVMLIFNLLPIYPSDGGRVLRSILELLGISALKSTIISIFVAILTSLIVGTLIYFLTHKLTYTINFFIVTLSLVTKGVSEIAAQRSETAKTVNRVTTDNADIIEILVRYYSDSKRASIPFSELRKFVKSIDKSKELESNWVCKLSHKTQYEIAKILERLEYMYGIDKSDEELIGAAITEIKSNTNLRLALYTYLEFLRTIFFQVNNECQLDGLQVIGEYSSENNIFYVFSEDLKQLTTKKMGEVYKAGIVVGRYNEIVGVVFYETIRALT